MNAELPIGGWKGYGAPSHPRTPRRVMYPNRAGVCIHEIHDEIAEYRLEREGIKHELALYLIGIGEASRG